MQNDQIAFVVLVDADDISLIHPSWPRSICLAACLMRNGECSFTLFHRSERKAIPSRLLRTHQLTPQSVRFVPPVEGFQTRPFLYSDERRLMALLSTETDLLEEATDYLVNYNYALEEGLRPEVLMKTDVPDPAGLAGEVGRRAGGESRPTNSQSAGNLHPLVPEFLRRSAINSTLPRFQTVRKRSPLAEASISAARF